MTARPTLASVVIPSQHQQVTTQQKQTQAHSSLPPIFSSPPFKPRNTESPTIQNNSEYYPQYNWQVSRKRSITNQQISSHKNKILKMNNIEDLVPDAIRKILSECLNMQKPIEH